MATPHRTVVLLLVAAATLVLSACGNKGSLVRPPPEPLDATEAPPAAQLPPPTEPAEADPPAEIEPPPAADPPSDPSTAPVSGDAEGDG